MNVLTTECEPMSTISREMERIQCTINLINDIVEDIESKITGPRIKNPSEANCGYGEQPYSIRNAIDKANDTIGVIAKRLQEINEQL